MYTLNILYFAVLIIGSEILILKYIHTLCVYRVQIEFFVDHLNIHFI